MDDDARWSQLVARDPAAEGIFIYAVKTTKIFCRPTCKARLARRANVEFFNTPHEAQDAGYRACKRCQPLLTTHTPEADKIKKAIALIDSIPDDAPLPGLERLAQEAGLTKHHFHRLFKRETGSTPRDYALARRQDRRSEATISATMTPLTPFSLDSDPFWNFADVGDFGEASGAADYQPDFPQELKLPSTQEVREATIYHDFIPTAHGVLLVAFRDLKICKIDMGQSEQELVDRLEMQFPPTYYMHCSASVASAEDAAIFQRLKDDVASGLNAPAPRAELDISTFLQLDGLEDMT